MYTANKLDDGEHVWQLTQLSNKLCLWVGVKDELAQNQACPDNGKLSEPLMSLIPVLGRAPALSMWKRYKSIVRYYLWVGSLSEISI